MAWINRALTVPESVRKLQIGKALGRMFTLPANTKSVIALAGKVAQIWLEYLIDRDPVTGTKKGENQMLYLVNLVITIILAAIATVQMVELVGAGADGSVKRAEAIVQIRAALNGLPIPSWASGAVAMFITDNFLGGIIDKVVSYLNGLGIFTHAATPTE